MRKRGARSATLAAQSPEKGAKAAPAVQVEEDPLEGWSSGDGGSFSDYDSEEETRRLKRRRRRLRAKREGAQPHE